MGWVIALVVTAVMPVAGRFPVGDAEVRPVQELVHTFAAYEGDPLGSVEAGTIKVVAKSLGLTHPGRGMIFRPDGHDKDNSVEGIPFAQTGRTVEVTAHDLMDGKIRLDITLSDATVAEKSEGRVQLRTETSRTVVTVRPGEVVKIRWGKGGTEKQQSWVELSAHENTRQPPPAAKTVP
jgi:hypothetical protein